MYKCATYSIIELLLLLISKRLLKNGIITNSGAVKPNFRSLCDKSIKFGT